MAFPDVPADGVHQMGLAEPDPAIEEERVVGRRRRLGDPPRRRVGELVGLADDEIAEHEARIERAADLPLGARRRDRFGGGAVAGGAAGRPGRLRAGLRRRQPLAFALGRFGLDLDIERGDRLVLVGPQLQYAPGEVLADIIAHETRRRRDAHHAPVHRDQGQGFQPAAIGGIAHLGPQHAAHPRPLRGNPRVDSGFRHGHEASVRRPVPRPSGGRTRNAFAVSWKLAIPRPHTVLLLRNTNIRD